MSMHHSCWGCDLYPRRNGACWLRGNHALQVSVEIKRATSWLTIGKLMLIPVLPLALASAMAIYVVCACAPPSAALQQPSLQAGHSPLMFSLHTCAGARRALGCSDIKRLRGHPQWDVQRPGVVHQHVRQDHGAWQHRRQ